MKTYLLTPPLKFLIISALSINTALSETPEAEAEDQVFELAPYTVTGSHFNNAELVADLPLHEIDNETLRLWNEQSVYTALLDQPFTYGYANSDTQSNGLTGSAGANLRGLGNLNTLTLINGRRAGGNSATGFEQGGFADLNLVPIAAIRKVEVAVDGTSVTYGSDAVGGTVNLLLHKDYIGNRVDSTYSNTTDGDAAEKRLSFLTGQALSERTHLVLVGSWYERNAIYARDRAISKNADFSDQGGTDDRSNTFPGRINVDGTAYALRDGVTSPDPMDSFSENYTSNFEGFNYNAYAPAVPELEQRSGMANITHELTDQVEIWSELLFTETQFDNGLAPAPWSVSAGNDLFTAANNSPHKPNLDGGTLTGLSYRNLPLDNLQSQYNKEASRLLLGLRGEVQSWDWEAAIMQIKSNLDVEWSGITDSEKLTARIADGSFNPYATSFASGSNGGFAFDNAEALRASATTAEESFDEEYRSFDFKTGGPVFELPAGEVLGLVGTEYRKEDIRVEVDPSIIFPATALGKTSGYTPYEAERSVFSFFGESLVPILDENNSDHQSLNLQLSLRYDDYTDESGGIKNEYNQLVYKAAISFSPQESITFNASFSTAFRAPTFNESFSDNYATLTYNTGTKESPNYQQYLTRLGANPDLDPEKSKILNLGVRYEPEAIQGLSASINYYRIETKDAINHNGQGLVDDGDIFFGFLVNATRFNTSEVLTDGLEYEVSYLHQNQNSQWEASLGINQVLRYDIRPTDDTSEIDFLGRLVHPLRPSSESVQGPGSIPEYKGYARLVWSNDRLTLGGTVNYIHSLDDDPTATFDGRPREIDSWASLDLVARYDWPEQENRWLSNTSLTLGIENVTDEEPPFAAGAFADGYDSSLYSLEGRRINLSLSKTF